MTINILSLPADILTLLPQYIHNIEDFTSFASTCHDLYTLTQTTSPQQILRLCSRSAPVFFSPHPHFLVAATINSVTSKVRSDPKRLPGLIDGFHGGIDGLYAYCLDHGSLTLADIRRWHALRCSTLYPLADAIDRMAGPKWSLTPEFWDGGVSEAETLYTDPERAAYQLVIYAEAFAKGAFDVLLRPRGLTERPVLDLATRLEYIKYCIPDESCKRGYPGLKVLQIGPYTKPPEGEQSRRECWEDQASLFHVLKCSRWRRLWQGLVEATGGYFTPTEVIPTEIEEQHQQQEEPEEEQEPYGEEDDLEEPSTELVTWNSEDDEDEDEDEHESVVSEVPDVAEIESSDQDVGTWKDDIWLNAVMFSNGIESIRVLMDYSKRSTLADEEKQRLVDIRRAIAELDPNAKLPGKVVGKYLRQFCSEIPNLKIEVLTCVATKWPGATARW